MSIKAHGGAVQYWVHEVRHHRVVMCNDGIMLELGSGGRWRVSELKMWALKDLGYVPDTRPSLSAAITRTNREARRSGSSEGKDDDPPRTD
jgi:hypothetical protein